VVLPNKNNNECFFNKFSYENSEIIECTDVDIVKKCGDILNSRSCNMARRIRFPYLESSLTISSTVFICLWDEVKQECILKELVKAVENEKETNIIFIMIIGVSCVCVVLSVIVIVVILVLRRRMHKSSQENEYEMSNVLSSVDKDDSKFYISLVEQHHCSEYTIGEKIGEYTIEKIIGRGVFFHYYVYLFC
jgi:hypothetical protein